MNAYADVRTLASENYLDLDSTRLAALKTELRGILEAVSRAIDSVTLRKFYCYEATRYFDGAGRYFKLDDDLLEVTTFKLDEDGDATYESTLAATDYILYPRNQFPKEWIKPAPDGDYGGFASGILNGVEIAGVWGYGDGISATPYRDSGDDVKDAGGINATVTTITVAAATNFGIGQTIRIDSEQMYIEDLDETAKTLTVRRAVNGTTGATHAVNADIYIYEYPGDIVHVCLIESIRAASGGNWLDVSGSPETIVFSVKKGFHEKSSEILKPYTKLGW